MVAEENPAVCPIPHTRLRGLTLAGPERIVREKDGGHEEAVLYGVVWFAEQQTPIRVTNTGQPQGTVELK